MKSGAEIEIEVQALTHLDIAGLREAWRRRYGAPPRLRSTDLLSRLLAWRIQADHFGGLDVRTIRVLANERVMPPPVVLQPGTRLAREYRGVRHEVEVVEDGFRYRDATYASLSVVAQAITGTKWNGLRFFGLREDVA